jgi:hypothetical protein
LLLPLEKVAKLGVLTSFIYVAEAHAEDEWPIGNRYRTDKESPLWVPALLASKTVEERAKRVMDVAKRYQLPSFVRLFVDRITDEKDRSNTLEGILGGWPTGFYVLQHNAGLTKLVHIVVPRNGIFELEEMWRVIDALLNSK